MKYRLVIQIFKDDLTTIDKTVIQWLTKDQTETIFDLLKIPNNKRRYLSSHDYPKNC